MTSAAAGRSLLQDSLRARSHADPAPKVAADPAPKVAADPAAVPKVATTAAPAATLEPTLCALLQSLRVTGAIQVLPAEALDAALLPAARPREEGVR